MLSVSRLAAAWVVLVLAPTLGRAPSQSEPDAGEDEREGEGEGEEREGEGEGDGDELTELRATSDLGSFDLVIEVPAELPLRESFAMRVRIERRSGAQRADVELRADAWMPAHGHGMAGGPPDVTAEGADNFLVDGMFFQMPGLWQLLFVVERAGSLPERATIDLDV